MPRNYLFALVRRRSLPLGGFLVVSFLTMGDANFFADGVGIASASKTKATARKAKARATAEADSGAAVGSASGDAAADAAIEAIAHVVHGTSAGNLGDILALFAVRAQDGNPPVEGGLLAGQRLNRGVFTSLLFRCNIGKRIPKEFCSKDIFLVFDTSVLKDLDYHSSNSWFGGGQFAPATSLENPEHRSYRKEQFPLFVENESPKYCSSVLEPNETVFTTNVVLSYLREIWVCNYSNLTKMISTPRPDGTYKRSFARQQHDAAGIAERVRDLIATNPNLADVSVRIVDSF